MAVTAQSKGEILFIEFSGVLSTADIKDLMERIRAVERDAAVVPHRIADFSQVSGIELTFRDMLGLAEQRKQHTFPNRFKTAIVASEPVHVGFARMFQTLMGNQPQIEVRTFPTREEGLAWLGEPMVETRKPV